MKQMCFVTTISILLPHANVHHSKFESGAVSWDLEGVIRIKRLEIGCDKVGEGGRGWEGKGEAKLGRRITRCF